MVAPSHRTACKEAAAAAAAAAVAAAAVAAAGAAAAVAAAAVQQPLSMRPHLPRPSLAALTPPPLMPTALSVHRPGAPASSARREQDRPEHHLGRRQVAPGGQRGLHRCRAPQGRWTFLGRRDGCRHVACATKTRPPRLHHPIANTANARRLLGSPCFACRAPPSVARSASRPPCPQVGFVEEVVKDFVERLRIKVRRLRRELDPCVMPAEWEINLASRRLLVGRVRACETCLGCGLNSGWRWRSMHALGSLRRRQRLA